MVSAPDFCRAEVPGSNPASPTMNHCEIMNNERETEKKNQRVSQRKDSLKVRELKKSDYETENEDS